VNPVVDVAAVVIGTQLIVCRLEYYRRGIYVGNGRVVHHTGRIRYPHGLIEEVSLADFVAGRPVRLGDTPCQSSACGVVRRARCRLGEQRYDLLQNNCEHFCTWCQTGRPRSPQVDALSPPILPSSANSAKPISVISGDPLHVATLTARNTLLVRT
jgi:Lecithin retinol acyltransferase